MGLETVTNVGDLVVTNPPGSDQKSQGDDHLRNIKTALRNSFAGFAGAILVTGVDGGAANAYTLTPTTALPAYSTKMLVEFTPNANSTGASTLNISALGTKAIITQAGVAIGANDLVSGCTYLAAYDGTSFRLISVTTEYVDAVRAYATSLAFATALPSQTGNSGKFVTTDGTNASWVDPFPSQGGNSGKFLTTNGAAISWGAATFQTAATAAEIKTGTDNTKVVTASALLSAQGFTGIFQTADQTITAAGALTIAHGLGRIPALLFAFLKNTSTEGNYSVGDIVPIFNGQTSTASTGAYITADATNIYIRFGSAASTFRILDKTGGTDLNITNSKWSYFVKVLA